jgi:hypothetical protein
VFFSLFHKFISFSKAELVSVVFTSIVLFFVDSIFISSFFISCTFDFINPLWTIKNQDNANELIVNNDVKIIFLDLFFVSIFFSW